MPPRKSGGVFGERRAVARCIGGSLQVNAEVLLGQEVDR
jgi:hypothetical protein